MVPPVALEAAPSPLADHSPTGGLNEKKSITKRLNSGDGNPDNLDTGRGP
jgi:hypothetical protein